MQALFGHYRLGEIPGNEPVKFLADAEASLLLAIGLALGSSIAAAVFVCIAPANWVARNIPRG